LPVPIIIIIIIINGYTWNVTHNTESTAVGSLKRKRWGSSLVQEKYRGEKAGDRRHTYRIIIIIIIIIVIQVCEQVCYLAHIRPTTVCIISSHKTQGVSAGAKERKFITGL